MKIVMVLYPCPGGEAGEETPLELLGCTDAALGLREWIEDQGHELVTTTALEGDDELYEHLQDAEVLITTPFWPVYANKEVLDARSQAQATPPLSSKVADYQRAQGP